MVQQVVEDVEPQRIGLDLHPRRDGGVSEHVLDARPIGRGHPGGQGGGGVAARLRRRPEQHAHAQEDGEGERTGHLVGSYRSTPRMPKPPPGDSASLLAHASTTSKVVGSGPCCTMM